MRRRLVAMWRLGVASVLAVCVPAAGWAQTVAGHGGMKVEAVKDDPTFWEQLQSLSILSIAGWRIGLALLLVVLGFFLRTYLLRRLLKPFALLATKTDTEVDDQLLKAVEAPMGWIVNMLGVYLAIMALKLPLGLERGALIVTKTISVVFVAWLLYNAVDVASLALDRFARATSSEMDDHLVPLVRKVLRIAIVLISLVMIIQQWGYDVTSLVAGLGLGGLAFALAAQQTLSNFFGSIMIFTDRPFKLGDWVKSKHGEGVVEEIGLRSTKIRTFAKTVITVPNADIAASAIENFSEMDKRRINFNIGVTYGTSRAQMEHIVEEIRELLAADEAIDQEFWAVNFTSFGASSLDIMIYCFTLTTNWKEFMDIRQRLYLDIMGVVERAGSGFAFPSQSLYVETPLRMIPDHPDPPAPALPPDEDGPTRSQSSPDIGREEAVGGTSGELA